MWSERSSPKVGEKIDVGSRHLVLLEQKISGLELSLAFIWSLVIRFVTGFSRRWREIR